MIVLALVAAVSGGVCPIGAGSGFPDSIAHQPDSLTLEAYYTALQALDFDAVKADIEARLTNSDASWPADFGNYGPFFIRLAWHCAGSYRESDGRGGCEGGRIRFNPESDWPDNGNLDQARALLEDIKQTYGDGLSYGDLYALAGTVAIESMGGPSLGFCGGRVDDDTGDASILLGPTVEQEELFPCPVEGFCESPLGTSTVGLIYVNPEGPGGVPDRALSAPDIRDVFGRMGMDDEETVALVGGGHAFGKAHGACLEAEPSTPGVCANNETVTSGFEGPWTDIPTTWSNQYFTNLLDPNWVVGIGPGGHNQWSNVNFPGLMMLTADLALVEDADYLAIVTEFANNITALEDAFSRAWYKLTTRDVGPIERCFGSNVPPQQTWQSSTPSATALNETSEALLADIFRSLSSDLEMRAEFTHLAFQCANTFRGTDFQGGCNGATILSSPEADTNDNANNLNAINTIQTAIVGFDVSMADAIVLAGTVAVEESGSTLLSSNFCGGRGDSGTGISDILTLFPSFDASDSEWRMHQAAMGLTAEEMVALMARPRSLAMMQSLGYGMTMLWGDDTQTTTLSNLYFQVLLNNDFTEVAGSPLYYEDLSGHGMTPSDILLNCEADLMAIATLFANDEASFLAVFSQAWTKLMNLDRVAFPTTGAPCSSNIVASAGGDPHFKGFHGERMDLTHDSGLYSVYCVPDQVHLAVTTETLPDGSSYMTDVHVMTPTSFITTSIFSNKSKKPVDHSFPGGHVEVKVEQNPLHLDFTLNIDAKIPASGILGRTLMNPLPQAYWDNFSKDLIKDEFARDFVSDNSPVSITCPNFK